MNPRTTTFASLALAGTLLAPPALANVAPPLEPPPTATTIAKPATPSPPAKGTQTRFIFTGRGWGHGVGMSQWGARGRALDGWATPRILKHYYRGTKLTRVRNRRIRVLLHTSIARGQVTAAGPWRVVTEGLGRTVRNLKPRIVYRVVVRDGRVTVLNPRGKVVTTAASSLRFEPRGSTILRMRQPGGVDYRGWLRFTQRDGLTDAINSVPMTQYLQGVVPREMPSAWGDDAPAALRAQAIAARSYALATRRRGGNFDAYNDTRSQVYGGVPAEDPRTNAAVRATRRVVLSHKGRVIPAFFFSTSGGRTEHNENVWPGTPRPYLRSVADPYDRVSPLHAWPDRPTFTSVGLGKRLGLDGPVTGMKVLSRGASPRVKEVLVVTRSGRRTRLTGAQIRSKLELRDTWFSVSRKRVTPS